MFRFEPLIAKSPLALAPLHEPEVARANVAPEQLPDKHVAVRVSIVDPLVAGTANEVPFDRLTPEIVIVVGLHVTVTGAVNDCPVSFTPGVATMSKLYCVVDEQVGVELLVTIVGLGAGVSEKSDACPYASDGSPTITSKRMHSLRNIRMSTHSVCGRR